jgi:hypothetical protein
VLGDPPGLLSNVEWQIYQDLRGEGVKLRTSLHVLLRLKRFSTLPGPILSITNHDEFTYNNGED